MTYTYTIELIAKGLNKSILDQGWGEFKRQLEYKLKWINGTYVEVAPQYSQKCSECGHINKDNRLTQANFCCKECNYTEHADINAALNILGEAEKKMQRIFPPNGHAVMACGASA